MGSSFLPAALAVPALAAPLAAQCFTEAVNCDAAWHRFGQDIALSGGTCIVGAPDTVVSGVVLAGVAVIYEREETGWVQTQTLASSAPTSFNEFGFSVDVDGNRAAVGAAGASGNVTIFELVGSSWVETQVIPGPGSPVWRFGHAVALEGETLLVGAPGAFGSVGRVYAYELVGGLWVETQVIAYGVETLFGEDIALEGDLAVVGAPGTYSFSSEAAYVLRFDGATWTEEAMLDSPSASDHDFGAAVSVSGNRLLVGAPDFGDGLTYVYQNGPVGWELETQLSLAPIQNGCGRSVSLEGTSAVVSCYGEVQVFEHDGFGWTAARLVLGQFAGTLAREGDRVLIASVDTLPTSTVARGQFLEASLAGANCWSFASDENILIYDVGGVELDLFAGLAHAGKIYFVLGSFAGLHPGTTVAGVLLPLAVDPYFWFTLLHPNQVPLTGSFGVLDANGEAQALFSLPGITDPSLNGLVAHHAYVVIDPATLGVDHVSNAVNVQLVKKWY